MAQNVSCHLGNVTTFSDRRQLKAFKQSFQPNFFQRGKTYVKSNEMYLQSAFHSTHYFMENHDVDVYTFFKSTCFIVIFKRLENDNNVDYIL